MHSPRTIDVLDGVCRLLLLKFLDRLSAATPGFFLLMLQAIVEHMVEHDFKGVVAVCLWGSNKVSTRSSRSDLSGLNG